MFLLAAALYFGIGLLRMAAKEDWYVMESEWCARCRSCFTVIGSIGEAEHCSCPEHEKSIEERKGKQDGKKM